MIRVSSKPAPSSAERIACTIPSSMQDGATTSAPARAWLTAIRCISTSDSSLRRSGPPSAQSPTTPHWPGLGVLAGADVGDHDEVRDRGADPADRLLDHARVVVRGRGRRVLGPRDAEEQDGADPGRVQPGRGPGDRVEGLPGLAGHGRDRHGCGGLFVDEERRDQLVGPQVVLGKERQQPPASQAPHAFFGVHASSPVICW